MKIQTTERRRRSVQPRWPLMHAVLAQGAASPNHGHLASTAEIAERTVGKVISDLSPTNVRYLSGGHPARLGPGLGLVLGLSIGSETVRGAMIDANGAHHHGRAAQPIPHQLSLPPTDLLARLKAVAIEVLSAAVEDEALQASPSKDLKLLGAAIAWPSPLDRDKKPGGWTLQDKSWRAPDMKTGKVLTIPERLASTLGSPFTASDCHALHDASAHALSVAFSEARQRAVKNDESNRNWRVSIVVRVGEGLGASVMISPPYKPQRLSFIDARLIEGAKGFAGELGHVRIDENTIKEINTKDTVRGLAPMDYRNWECSCGRRYHLEAFASGLALVRRLEASGYEIPKDGAARAKRLREALSGNADDVERQAGIDIGRVIGHALAGPILILDPSRITLTGPLASPYLVRGVQRVEDVWANIIDDSVEIGIDEHVDPEYIGAIGAGLAVIRRSIYRDFLDAKTVAPSTFPFGKTDLESMAAYQEP